MTASVVYSNHYESGFTGSTLTFTPTGAAVDDIVLFCTEFGNAAVSKPAAWTTIYTQDNFVGFHGGYTRVWGYKMQASDFTSGSPNAITVTLTAYRSHCSTVHVVRGLSGVPTTYTLTGPTTMSSTPLVIGAQTASSSAPKLIVFAGSSPSTSISSVNMDAVTLNPQGVQQNAHLIRAGVIDQNTSDANTTNSGSARIDYLILAVDLVLASSGTQYAAAGTVAAASSGSGSATARLVAAGTDAAVTAVTGSTTALLPASGTVAGITAVTGSTGGVPLDASGTVSATSGAAGATTALLGATGQVDAITDAAAATGLRAVALGVAAAVSAVTGSTFARYITSGVVAAVSGVRGAAVVPQVPVDTPPARTLTITTDDRSMSVLPETRVLQVTTETRTLGVTQ